MNIQGITNSTLTSQTTPPLPAAPEATGMEHDLTVTTLFSEVLHHLGKANFGQQAHITTFAHGIDRQAVSNAFSLTWRGALGEVDQRTKDFIQHLSYNFTTVANGDSLVDGNELLTALNSFLSDSGINSTNTTISLADGINRLEFATMLSNAETASLDDTDVLRNLFNEFDNIDINTTDDNITGYELLTDHVDHIIDTSPITPPIILADFNNRTLGRVIAELRAVFGEIAAVGEETLDVEDLRDVSFELLSIQGNGIGDGADIAHDAGHALSNLANNLVGDIINARGLIDIDGDERLSKLEVLTVLDNLFLNPPAVIADGITLEEIGIIDASGISPRSTSLTRLFGEDSFQLADRFVVDGNLSAEEIFTPF